MRYYRFENYDNKLGKSVGGFVSVIPMKRYEKKKCLWRIERHRIYVSICSDGYSDDIHRIVEFYQLAKHRFPVSKRLDI